MGIFINVHVDENMYISFIFHPFCACFACPFRVVVVAISLFLFVFRVVYARWPLGRVQHCEALE